MHKKRSKYFRPLAAVGAAALAATLVLGGTMAWQSMNQVVRNENTHPVNAGGRLHDDFNGTNKDVYAENFGDSELIVRVRLDEFMETGADAGKENPETNSSRTPLDSGASFDKPETWKTYIMGGELGNSHKYLTFKLGGQTTYLPTFNKNKDSLKADVNGTYQGGDDGQHFSDYKTYTVGTGVSGTEEYSISNGPAGGTRDDGKNIITLADQKHYPQLSGNAEVISMDTWKAKGDDEKMGAFWVYDKDGWAYWAEPLLPATATGLLLDEVKMTTIPDQDWYYAINVVAQFATVTDIGTANVDGGGTGFYDTDKGKAPSEDAKKLLEMLSSSNSHRGALSSELSTKVRAVNGTTDTVKIDETDFYVLDVSGNQALLMAKNFIPEATKNAFGPTNNWKDSIARVECQRWLNDKTELRKAVLPQLIKTRKQVGSTEFDVTGDRVFLLSEADVFGQMNGTAALPDDYTWGKVLKTDTNKSIFTVPDKWWWLRSPRNSASHVSYIDQGGTNTYYGYIYAGGSLRPALVVNLAS